MLKLGHPIKGLWSVEIHQFWSPLWGISGRGPTWLPNYPMLVKFVAPFLEPTTSKYYPSRRFNRIDTRDSSYLQEPFLLSFFFFLSSKNREISIDLSRKIICRLDQINWMESIRAVLKSCDHFQLVLGFNFRIDKNLIIKL